MGTFLEDQKIGSQLQTKLPTRYEARFLRGILWCGGCFLTALAVVVIQQIYIARTFAAHLKAGGIDDPDAVFSRNFAGIILEGLTLFASLGGLVICFIGWAVSWYQRQKRARRQLRQW